MPRARPSKSSSSQSARANRSYKPSVTPQPLCSVEKRTPMSRRRSGHRTSATRRGPSAAAPPAASPSRHSDCCRIARRAHSLWNVNQWAVDGSDGIDDPRTGGRRSHAIPVPVDLTSNPTPPFFKAITLTSCRYDELGASYARAREQQQHLRADELLEIVDDSRNDWLDDEERADHSTVRPRARQEERDADQDAAVVDVAVRTSGVWGADTRGAKRGRYDRQPCRVAPRLSGRTAPHPGRSRRVFFGPVTFAASAAGMASGIASYYRRATLCLDHCRAPACRLDWRSGLGS
jgi:hypothetical protein